MPSSEVYDIVQDDYGYIWFCTDKGLSRYNGYEFENFDINNGLPENVVFNFFKQKNGDIWCSTRSVLLFKINGLKPEFSNYKYNDLINNHPYKTAIKNIHIASDQSILISMNNYIGYYHITHNGKILKQHYYMPRKEYQAYLNVIKTDDKKPFLFFDIDNHFATNFPKNSLVKSKFSIDNINYDALYFPQCKSAILIQGNEIFLQNENGLIQKIDIQNKKRIISSGKINASSFWIGYLHGGIKVFNLKGQELDAFLPNESVSQLINDNEGSVWISTLYNGVYQIKNSNIRYISETVNKRVSSLETVKEQGVYIGYVDGNIDFFGKKKQLNRFYQSKESNPSIIFNDTLNDIIYFSSDDLFSTKNDFLSAGHSYYIVPNNNVVLAGITGTNVINTLDTSESFLIFFPLKMNDVIFYNSRIYGGNVNGLSYLEHLTDTSVHSTSIDNIRIDDLNRIDDYLVLGTNGAGIIILNKANQIVLNIKKSNGLIGNFVNQTFTENDSTLWVCTTKGLNRIIRYTGNKFKIDQIDQRDGLLSNEIWDIGLTEEFVFIGTQKGVNYLTIDAFNEIQKQNEPYFFHWTKTMVNEKEFNPSIKTHFSYNENKFQFNFESLSFRKKKGIFYRYILKGAENNWNFTKARTVSYSSLSPGEYKLIIQAKTRNDKWESNEISYHFFIAPPFWSTWWFICFVVIVVIGIIYLFFKVRILLYNADIVREILRLIMRRLRKEQPFILIRDKVNQVKVYSCDIHIVKTNGNYLELYTDKKTYLTRSSLKQFLDDVSDKVEYIQVHRSYLIRIDKIQEIGAKTIVVFNNEIPIGRKYAQEVKQINL